jgi:L-aspartate oxidase
MFDLLVLGSGIAGLSGAVHAARAGWSVIVLTKGELAHSATRYAQGGVAAALDGRADDSPELHLSDTIAAGAGLCDPDAVRVLVSEGPERVRELISMGAVFDQTGDGEAAALALAREGGHSAARVLHAGGDATGAEIERALVAAVEATTAEVREGWLALDLLVEEGRAAGVMARSADGATTEVRARHTMVATGGAGQCFAVTTNPALSTGDGIAMALRAGVAVADVEFMQFHPTALHHPAMPRPLLSEALRGEGAVLRDRHGRAFMADEHPLGDLAPRDVVARAITRRLHEQGTDHLWLDATSIRGFEARFPTIWRACRAVGLDPRRDWLPVAPAAHYLCGGVCTDLDGATTLPGLWACGEAACSGVHGANRLASNSLLEGVVFAAAAAEEALARIDDLPPSREPVEPWREGDATESSEAVVITQNWDEIRRFMWNYVGIVRSDKRLARARHRIDVLRDEITEYYWNFRITPNLIELRNLALVAQLVIESATRRLESRGLHYNLDHPERDDVHFLADTRVRRPGAS